MVALPRVPARAYFSLRVQGADEVEEELLTSDHEY